MADVDADALIRMAAFEHVRKLEEIQHRFLPHPMLTILPMAHASRSPVCVPTPVVRERRRCTACLVLE